MVAWYSHFLVEGARMCKISVKAIYSKSYEKCVILKTTSKTVNGLKMIEVGPIHKLPNHEGQEAKDRHNDHRTCGFLGGFRLVSRPPGHTTRAKEQCFFRSRLPRTNSNLIRRDQLEGIIICSPESFARENWRLFAWRPAKSCGTSEQSTMAHWHQMPLD